MPQHKNQPTDPQPEETLAQKITGMEIYQHTAHPRRIVCVNENRKSATKYTIITDKGPSIPVSDLRTFINDHGLEV